MGRGGTAIHIKKEAGAEARNRRKKALEDHFEKLNKTIKDAASIIQVSVPT